MGVVKDGNRAAVRPNHHVSSRIRLRRKGKTGVVLLVPKLADRRIQRHGPDVSAVVEEDLGFAIAEGVDANAYARRPVSCENVADESACGPLLFKTDTAEERNVPVELPIVVRVGSFVNPLGQNLRG